MTDEEIDPRADHVLRAMTDDGAFRVMTVRCTQTVLDAVASQGVRGRAASELGEMIVSAVLVRETMAPAFRVQVSMRDEDGNQIIGDSFAEGRTRGLVRVRDDALGVRLHRKGYLQVSRSLPGKAPHEGVVAISPDDGVDAALHDYFRKSEQIETMVSVACVSADDEVIAAGGYVVQLLPELTEPPLARMRERLEDFGSLPAHLEREDASPQTLLDGILGDSAYTRLHDSTVQFACVCGPEKAVGAVSTLGRDDVQEMLAEGRSISVTCDYCQSKYEVGPTELREVLDAMDAPSED